MKTPLLALIAAAVASVALVQPPALKPPLAGIGFLVGDWTSDDGRVADTASASKGSSHITVAADGQMLLRQDRIETFDAKGKPAGSLSQVMLIYLQDETLHAD